MSNFLIRTNNNQHYGTVLQISRNGSEYYMTPRQVTCAVQLLSAFATKRKQGSLTENGNWESGRVTLSYSACNQLVRITTYGTVLPHDLASNSEPTCSLTVQYCQVKELVESMSAVLGLSPTSNVDGKFFSLWVNNVAVGVLMTIASLVLLLPPIQRTRWIYQWLIRTADDVAVNSEHKTVQANLGATC